MEHVSTFTKPNNPLATIVDNTSFLQNAQRPFLDALVCLHALLHSIPSSINKSRVPQLRGVFAAIASKQLCDVEAIGSLGSVRIGVIVCTLDIKIGVQTAKKRCAFISLVNHILASAIAFSSLAG